MDIKVYRLSTCRFCEQVESFLNEYEVKFSSIVVDSLPADQQEKAISEAYSLSKQRSFPVTIIDGACVIGFHESKLRDLLKLPLRVKSKERILSSGTQNKGCLFPTKAKSEKSSSTIDNGGGRFFTSKTKNVAGLENIRVWLAGEANSRGYKENPDQELVNNLLQNLLANEKQYGYKACPTRQSKGKYQLDHEIICPCSDSASDIEKHGRCHCGLFVSDSFMLDSSALSKHSLDIRENYRLDEKPHDFKMERVMEVSSQENHYNAYIKIMGFNQDKTDKNSAREGLLKITERFNIEESSIEWTENTAIASKRFDDKKITIKLKKEFEFFTFQIICTEMDEKRVNCEKLFEPIDPADSRDKIFECIVIVPGNGFTKDDAERLVVENKHISSIYDKYQIVAELNIDEGKRDVFILKTGEYAPEMILENIELLETNCNLLQAEKQRFILAEDRLNHLDSKFVAKMSAISMNLATSNPKMLKDWLHGLSNDFGEISGIAEESRYHMSYVMMKRDSMRRVFREWNEKASAFDYPMISRCFVDTVDNLGDQYKQLFTRNESIRREMSDLISMLRAKIDLNIQEQSLELQQSIDNTAKTQMKVQHLVEGLSIIALSYYATHLAGFIFEGLEENHLIHISPATLEALFLPVALLLSYYLTFRARKIITKKQSAESKGLDEEVLKSGEETKKEKK